VPSIKFERRHIFERDIVKSAYAYQPAIVVSVSELNPLSLFRPENKRTDSQNHHKNIAFFVTHAK
jgi:hypothetical protein